MVPSYEAFIRPVIDALSAKSPSTYDELARTVAAELDLTEEQTSERFPWDGTRVIEGRTRKATEALAIAGLVQREGDRVRLTDVGRTARADLPRAIDVEVLVERFPTFAAYRTEYLQRRGA